MVKFKRGEKVQWRLGNEKLFYMAEVEDSDKEKIILKLIDKPERRLYKGIEVIMRVDIDDFYTEVLDYTENRTITLKPIWGDKRKYFRVDDFLPITLRKITDEEQAIKRARVIPVYGLDVTEVSVPDIEDLSLLRMWKALSGIASKVNILNYYMEIADKPLPDNAEKVDQVLKLLEQVDYRLTQVMQEVNISRYKLLKAEHRKINISAAGVRCVLHEKVEADDLVELKLLLPTHPPIGVVTAAKVIRAIEVGKNKYDVALDFASMDDSVRDQIIFYALNRQREILKQQRGED